MAIGILLGNFVPSTGPTLQKGQFVGVSVPIGMSSSSHPSLALPRLDPLSQDSLSVRSLLNPPLTLAHSHRPPSNDVPHPLQSPLRNPPPPRLPPHPLDPNRRFLPAKLDLLSPPHARPRMGFPARPTRVARRAHLRRHRALHSHGPHLDRLGWRRYGLLRRAGGV